MAANSSDSADHAPPPPAADAAVPVRVGQQDVERLFAAGDILAHVHIAGAKRTAPAVFASGVDAIQRSKTVEEAAFAAERAKVRWGGMNGLFKDISWSLEPLHVDAAELAAAKGRDRNVVVRFDVKEARSRWDMGISTSAAAVPELNLSAFGIFGRPWDVSLLYLPSMSAVPSGELRFSSQLPAFGDRCDYVIARRIESRLTNRRPCPIADSETVTEAKVAIQSSSGGDGAGRAPLQHQVTFGLQDRTLAARDADSMPEALRRLFGTDSKLFWRWSSRYSVLGFNEHPRLAKIYSLPVSGVTVANRFEAFNVARGEAAEATRDPLATTFIKHDLQASAFVKLLPSVVLDLNVALGSVFSLQSFADAAASTRGGNASPAASSNRVDDVPLADRCFVSWRQVRGWRALGPTTFDAPAAANSSGDQAAAAAAAQPNARPKVFRALGGDAMWAASAVLNMPFLLYPENGALATHLFANVGNVRRFGNVQNAVANWRELFSGDGVSASVGGGLVVTALPQIFSAMGPGRLEATWSVPFTYTPGGKGWAARHDLVSGGAQSIFESFKWGLHWCSLEM